jgi:hypothetical protein
MIIENNDETKKKILKAVVILIVGLFVGTLITSLYYRSKIKKIEASPAPPNQASKNTSFFSETSTLPDISKIPIPDEITSISGTVEKIEGTTLTVKANVLGEERTYTVTAGDNTKIEKKKLDTNLKPEKGEPYNSYIVTAAKFSDIRQNDTVSIEAGGSIKDKTSFEASTISIMISNPSNQSPDNNSFNPSVSNTRNLPDSPTSHVVPLPPK